MPKTELHGLLIERLLNEQIILDCTDGRMIITVVETGEHTTKLLFTGPREIAVWRGEIVEKREGAA